MGKVFPAIYDIAMKPLENGAFKVIRQELIDQANGRVLEIGAGKMKQPFLAGLQDVLTRFWKKVCDGCYLNRDSLQLIKDSGLEVKAVKSYYKGLFLVVECTNSK